MASLNNCDGMQVLVVDYCFGDSWKHDRLGEEYSIAVLLTLREVVAVMKANYLHLLSDRYLLILDLLSFLVVKLLI